MFFLSLVRIPFFIGPKLSQNNFSGGAYWGGAGCWGGGWGVCWGGCWSSAGWGGAGWSSAGWDIKYIVSGGKFWKGGKGRK